MRESLKEKQIVLGVTGSIAAVETVRLTHALRRRGARVTAVMSAAATRIIHPDALTYATGNETGGNYRQGGACHPLRRRRDR